jgi:Rapamycin-insensitive companion of mTOR, N-term
MIDDVCYVSLVIFYNILFILFVHLIYFVSIFFLSLINLFHFIYLTYSFYVIILGDIFPVAFARSLVAISNHRDDNLRRVCVETLRELSVENTRVVAVVNGLTTLLDIVLEPTSQDMAEPILVSLLFLLNDPKSR